jgi:hypothetical protein
MESEFSNLMKQFGMKGGDFSDSDSDLDKSDKSDKSDKYEKREKRPYSEAKYNLQIGCIVIEQKRDDDKGTIDYYTRVCKKPKINFKFFDNEIKYALVVKGAMKYVNEHMQMKYVTNVTIMMGKKKIIMTGGEGGGLGNNINIEKTGDIDEIHIVLK